MDLSSNWSFPTSVRIGKERLKEIGDCCVNSNISKLPLVIVNASLIMVFTHIFIITRGSIKLFEATSILLSKSATTLLEIPSFYCFVGNCNRFVGNPMPKFQLIPWSNH